MNPRFLPTKPWLRRQWVGPTLRGALLFCLGLPLAGQVWDVRWDLPFAKGQSLPQTQITGSGQSLSGDLDLGKGALVSLNRRLLVLGPVIRFEGALELSRLEASGRVFHGSATTASRLRQAGVGLGLNAQFWIPFTGVAGELGLLQRLQNHSFESSGVAVSRTLSRTWFRVGARWRLPMAGWHPYLAASYQEPLNKQDPVRLNSATEADKYLQAQGPGLEFERIWTFGVGIYF